jgi:hypothetical protein
MGKKYTAPARMRHYIAVVLACVGALVVVLGMLWLSERLTNLNRWYDEGMQAPLEADAVSRLAADGDIVLCGARRWGTPDLRRFLLGSEWSHIGVVWTHPQTRERQLWHVAQHPPRAHRRNLRDFLEQYDGACRLVHLAQPGARLAPNAVAPVPFRAMCADTAAALWHRMSSLQADDSAWHAPLPGSAKGDRVAGMSCVRFACLLLARMGIWNEAEHGRPRFPADFARYDAAQRTWFVGDRRVASTHDVIRRGASPP